MGFDTQVVNILAIVLNKICHRFPAPFCATIEGGQSMRSMRRLTRGTDFERCVAASELGNSSDPRAVDVLMDALRSDTSSEVKSRVTKALGKLKDPRAVPLLVAVVEGKLFAQSSFPGDQNYNHALLQEAGDALVSIHHMSAVEPLILILTDRNSPNRPEAASILGKLGDRRAVPGLLAAVREMRPAHSYAWGSECLGEAAIRALGALGDPEAVEPLKWVLTESLPLDHCAWARCAVADALAELRDPRATSALIRVLKERDWERQPTEWERSQKRYIANRIYLGHGPLTIRVIRALASIGDISAIEPLTRLLAVDNHPVRNNAATALGHLRATSAIPALAAMLLSDEDPALPVDKRIAAASRACAARALEELGVNAAIAPLVEALINDQYSDVRGAAFKALKTIDQDWLRSLTEVSRYICQLVDNLIRYNGQEFIGNTDGDERHHEEPLYRLHGTVQCLKLFLEHRGVEAETDILRRLCELEDGYCLKVFFNCWNEKSAEKVPIDFAALRQFARQELYRRRLDA
jgi:HEAT repeat protein